MRKYLIINIFLSFSAFAGIQFERTTDLPELLKPALVLKSPSGGSLVRNIDLTNLQLNLNGRERFLVELPGSLKVYEQGMPILPTITERVASKEGFETEIVLVPEVIEKSIGSVPFELTPKALVWSPTFDFVPLQLEGLYPGSFLRVSKIGGHTVAVLSPVQQDLRTGQTFILRKSALWVKYNAKEISLTPVLPPAPQSIIVSSRKLQSSAEKLAGFHRETNRITSQIMYVEDLQNEPMVSEENLPDGYKNGDDKNEIVTGYNFELAKKLVHYLQEKMTANGSRLRYVTLLGNSEQVPPSYYFTLPAVFGKKWGVTDQCYSSLKKCLEPQVALGRLPFSTNEEVDLFLAKARAYGRKQAELKKELGLVGGKAFPNSEVYVGELGTLRTIQDPGTDWVGVQKSFRTKFNYQKKNLLAIASGESESRFVYALDHGKGNQWFVEHDFVSSDDIEKQKSVENPNNPVVVSIACSNGAFDETLAKEPIFGDAKFGKKSVGTSLLQARGGAIAYWGQARPGIGNPIYQIDLKGNLELQGSNYGLQMLEGFFEGYRLKRQGRLGDFVLQAQRSFAIERGNKMEEQGNAWTYYITTLLGDPTLVLPVRPNETVSNEALAESKTEFAKGAGLPVLEFEEALKFRLEFTSPSTVDATLFQWVESEFGSFLSEKVIVEEKGISGAQALSLDLQPEDSYGTYFLRLENTRGVPRERQVWFKAQSK